MLYESVRLGGGIAAVASGNIAGKVNGEAQAVAFASSRGGVGSALSGALLSLPPYNHPPHCSKTDYFSFV